MWRIVIHLIINRLFSIIKNYFIILKSYMGILEFYIFLRKTIRINIKLLNTKSFLIYYTRNYQILSSSTSFKASSMTFHMSKY